MLSTFSYEIGAIFLLCAMLMYGTMSGFLPRVFHAGKPAPMILGVFLFGFMVYHFWPDLSDGLRSILADMPRASAPAAVPTSPTPATKPAVRPATHIGATWPAVQHWKATIVDAPPMPAKSAPIVGTPGPSSTDARPGANAVFVTNSELTAPAVSSADDPYDSGLKRGLKRVGRFLHIHRKKDDQQ